MGSTSLKVLTYNVNGIRSAINKGLVEWLIAVGPDVVCLQEIKANPEQFDITLFENIGYHHFWYPAVKKGYSGVAILSKQKPDGVIYGMGIDAYDSEGRIMQANFGDLSVICAYFPSGASGEGRQTVKMSFLADFDKYIKSIQQQYSKLIIAGDYNVCHKAIDIHNPISNAKSPGFTPEERAWFDKFIGSGFIDAFRYFNPNPHNYTWWSNWSNARARNLGWRIDYQLISENLLPRLKRAVHLPDAKHSDHCPVMIEIAC